MSSEEDQNTHFYITCGVCGSEKAYSWYDKEYKEYLRYCPDCDNQVS